MTGNFDVGRAAAYPLRRREVVARLLADRGDLLAVGGLGASNWDITAIGDTPLNFPLWGAMGGAAMVGFGLALAQPDRRVLVVTGDGDMLMGLGSLASIAAERPANLAIVVIDNERFGETGMQPTHTAARVDLAGVAAATGFALTGTVRDEAGLTAALPVIRGNAGPVFYAVKVKDEALPFVMPPKDGAYLKDRFRLAVLGPDAVAP